MDELRFDDRVVIVTGAGRGIGRAHARLLASKGASVVVADVGAESDGSGASTQPANDVVAQIEAAGGTAVAAHASVADEAGATSIVASALEQFGRLDAVINNAGIIAPVPFEDESIEQFRGMLDVHYFGTLFMTKAAWPHFTAVGGGRIVNTVSEGMLGVALSTGYGAAKGAVYGLSRNLALAGAPLGIRVNCVAPRAATRMAVAFGAALASASDGSPQGGAPDGSGDGGGAGMAPRLVAPAAAFLAHESCPINGEVLLVGNGQVARLAMVLARGITKPDLTAEDIAANLDVVMDLGDASAVALGDAGI